MKIIVQELKKCLMKRHILILWIILLIVKLVYGIVFSDEGRDINLKLEESKSTYMQYLQKLEGKVSGRKDRQIKKILAEYEAEYERLLKAGDDEYFGTISAEEYTKKYLAFAEKYGNERAMSVLQSQYEYISEDREHRYFVYYNGWVDFFSNAGMDMYLLFLVILAATPIYCKEYEDNMDILNCTTKWGREALCCGKMATGVILLVLFAVSFCMADICVSQIKYGLPDWGYPVQSIHTFSECPWKISIGGMLLFSLCLSVIGLLYLVSVIFMCSVIAKKAVPVIVSTISFLFLPYFIFNEEILYHFPLPAGFFVLKGFIFGVWSSENGEYTFLSKSEIFSVLGMTFTVIVLCLMAAYIFYMGKVRFRCKYISKMFCILMCSLLFLTGCSFQTETDNLNGDVYNSKGFGYLVLSQDYAVSACDDIILHTAEGEERLFRDALSREEMENISLKNVSGRKLYYVCEDNKTGDFVVKYIDLESFSRHTVYEHKIYTYDGVPYLNFGKNNVTGAKLLENRELSTCWVAGGELFMIWDEDVYCVNCLTKKRTLLIKDVQKDVISYAGGMIFYLDKSYQLYCYSLETGNSVKLSEKLVSDCYATQECVYYHAMDGEVYAYNLEDGQQRCICTNESQLLNADEKYLYFSGTDADILRVDAETGQRDSITFESDVVQMSSRNNGKEVYAVLYKNEELYFVSKEVN